MEHPNRSAARRGDRRGIRRLSAFAAGLGLVASLSLVAAPAFADEYDRRWAGHPVRIAAYILHPVGMLIETILVRPAHWVVNHEPFKTIFGHTDPDEAL